MTQTLLPAGALPCLWMSAGVLSYRLCDRAYECETCPLDGALRGDRELVVGPGTEADRPDRLDFPGDRRYGRGHLWLGEAPDGTYRMGLDALAASLLPVPTAVRWSELPRAVAAGEPVCELVVDGEPVPLSAPVGATLVAANLQLTSRLRLALTDPYGEGWIAGFRCSGDVSASGLGDSAEARERARLDLRLFRRRIALHLLADTVELGTIQADGGVRLTDIRCMVGRRVLLGLLRELVH